MASRGLGGRCLVTDAPSHAPPSIVVATVALGDYRGLARVGFGLGTLIGLAGGAKAQVGVLESSQNEIGSSPTSRVKNSLSLPFSDNSHLSRTL